MDEPDDEQPQGPSSQKGKPKGPRNRPALPATEEAIYAHYLVCQSYTRTAEKYGLPLSTVWTMIQRIGRDALEDERRATRADIALKAWKKVEKLIDTVEPSNLGTEKSSQGFEAARSADAIARVANSLEPKDKDAGNVVPTINVYTGLRPEEPAQQPEDSSSTTGDRDGT